ncbi:fructosamine kinase family protein [Vibrio sp. S4M6]|uniref:fructosamine kinase family protein n=1 Tax=Vibrio sinus TaxID=2946865 RepID=UPI00202A870C|nr:fructosamine kinase family protein [Vibrio sinus]MCL9783298.1 fructosamine kinase family protein [Vibrio sinus]
MWQAISQQLSEKLMFSFNISEKTKLSGGDISESYMISDGQDRYFVKVNTRECHSIFEIEAENIKALRTTDTIYIPELVMTGTTKSHSFIVLNYLSIKPLDDPQNSYLFGQQLARLHSWGDQGEYGFDRDNYIGTTIQPNPWHRKWHRFFSEQRIGWQLQLLSEKGINLVDISELTRFISEVLSSHHPKPSLLHGDLWSGNAGNSAFGPICFDPACYWGDRECDIAMTELFKGFLPEFYQGYQSVLPLDSGYQQRKDIYNLYHVLNHCNQFGGHYLAQAESLIDTIVSR